MTTEKPTWAADAEGKCHAGCPSRGMGSAHTPWCNLRDQATLDGRTCYPAAIVAPLAAEVDRHEALCSNATNEVDRMAKRLTEIIVRVEALESAVRGAPPHDSPADDAVPPLDPGPSLGMLPRESQAQRDARQRHCWSCIHDASDGHGEPCKTCAATPGAPSWQRKPPAPPGIPRECRTCNKRDDDAGVCGDCTEYDHGRCIGLLRPTPPPPPPPAPGRRRCAGGRGC
jgi:hypothetical protein